VAVEVVFEFHGGHSTMLKIYRFKVNMKCHYTMLKIYRFKVNMKCHYQQVLMYDVFWNETGQIRVFDLTRRTKHQTLATVKSHWFKILLPVTSDIFCENVQQFFFFVVVAGNHV